MQNDVEFNDQGESLVPILTSNTQSEFLTKVELAKLLKKTPRTIEVWSKKGILPHYKIGKTVLYNLPDVTSHLRSFYRREGR